MEDLQYAELHVLFIRVPTLRITFRSLQSDPIIKLRHLYLATMLQTLLKYIKYPKPGQRSLPFLWAFITLQTTVSIYGYVLYAVPYLTDNLALGTTIRTVSD